MQRDPLYSGTTHTKPLCMLSGVPLLSIPSEVYRVLKHAGLDNRLAEFLDRARRCLSRERLLRLAREYVEVE